MTHARGYWESAVCGGHEMRHGRHYATFTLRGQIDAKHDASLGVVGPSFDPTDGHEGYDHYQGWVLAAIDGDLWHASRQSSWEGQPDDEIKCALKEGDVVVRLPPLPRHAAAHSHRAVQGLLLDCEAATLTVWVNGERKGVMVRPGMTGSAGQPVGRLEGPLRWAVDLSNTSVAIAGPLPPPS